MGRHTWKENLISALLGIAIGLPISIYAVGQQAETREREAEARQEIIEEQRILDTYEYTPVIEIEPVQEAEKEEIKPLFTISEEEFEMMAQIVCAETYADDMEGKQYVADVILNRVDDPRFPDTITEVILQDGQFSTASQLGQITPQPLDYGCVVSELNDRKNDEIVFFTCTRYIGTPCFECGGNYFGK